MNAPTKVILATLMLWCMHAAYGDVVHQRGDLPALEGRITRFDDQGITVSRGEGDDVFVRWDFVRSVEKDNIEDSLKAYLKATNDLWRARTRLERGDTALAEPLFEQFFSTYQGQTHVMALLAAEGLLRCRLAHGVNEGAVIPALEVARLRRALPDNDAFFATDIAVLDEATSLCPMLPPVWPGGTALVKLERDLGHYRAAENDPVVRTLAALYRRAAQRQLGIRVTEELEPTPSDHPGVVLLHAVVESSARTAESDAVKATLIASTGGASEWVRAWSDYFLGIVQWHDTAPSPREAGLVRLARVAATYGESQPYLAGMALAKLAEACDASAELGGSVAAASIRTELFNRFPSHPVLTTFRRFSTSGADRTQVKESL